MFTPIDVTSTFTLLESNLKISDYVARGKELGYRSLALSDEDNLYGALTFYQACQAAGIRPILGLKLNLNFVGSKENVLFIALNQAGYQNLLQLSSLKLTQTDRREALTWRELAPYLADLAVIMPDEASPVANRMNNGHSETVGTYLNEVYQYTTELYVSVSPQMSLIYRETLLAEVAKTSVKLIAGAPVHYLTAQDAFHVKVLRAIKDGSKLSAEDLEKKEPGKNWLRPVTEYAGAFKQNGLSQAFENNQSLVAKVDLHLEFPAMRLPVYPTPQGQAAKDYLTELCYQGLEARLEAEAWKQHRRADYTARLQHELAVINRMGFADYFLIVWDITNFAHQQDILLGPGRGSAAGSLVAYVLKITDVDPLQYGLLFERFLNEERVQMPDIDLDLPDNRRDQVIAYVHDKYGHQHVAQIITFGSLGAKQVIRDVGRVMGFSMTETDRISKLLTTNQKLSEAFQEKVALSNLIQSSQKLKLLWQTALALEGLPRHFSTHAAGIVLSDEDLTQIVPVQLGNDGILLSQYAKGDVEAVGLLKIDLLGLTNLSLLANALRLVEYGYKVKLSQIPLDDSETLALFARGQTTGIFQFDSRGIRGALRQVAPSSFEDVVAVNALYRPGPMQNIPEFVQRKQGQKQAEKLPPVLGPILNPTYGIMVYQEQVMQVATTMGGLTLGQADNLRRAMSKKDHVAITNLQNLFIQGALRQGYSQEIAQQTADFIARFGNYGFNRSHAVAYSKMAFELAYIKVHYPAAFFAALLNKVAGDSQKTAAFIQEAKERQVKIHLPALNHSAYSHILLGQTIYYGLGNIKGVRRDLVTEILQERKRAGNFQSIADFTQRISDKWVKKEMILPLIYAGVFDDFENDRNKVLQKIETLLEKQKFSGQNELLAKLLAPKNSLKLADTDRLEADELLLKEAEVLGAYISHHPLDKYRQLAIVEHTVPLIKLQANQPAKVLVYLQGIREITDKNHRKMAFLTVADQNLQLEAIIFAREYELFSHEINNENGKVWLMEVKPQWRNDQMNLIVNKMYPARKLETQCWYLRFDEHVDRALKTKVLAILQHYKGQTPVVVYDLAKGSKTLLGRQYWLRKDTKIKEELTFLLGDENVVLK